MQTEEEIKYSCSRSTKNKPPIQKNTNIRLQIDQTSEYQMANLRKF